MDGVIKIWSIYDPNVTNKNAFPEFCNFEGISPLIAKLLVCGTNLNLALSVFLRLPWSVWGIMKQMWKEKGVGQGVARKDKTDILMTSKFPIQLFPSEFLYELWGKGWESVESNNLYPQKIGWEFCHNGHLFFGSMYNLIDRKTQQHLSNLMVLCLLFP